MLSIHINFSNGNFRFTRQTGYPVLFIKKNDKKEFEIQQFRFLKSGVDKNDQTLWEVPLTWKTLDGSSKTESKIFGERKITLPAPNSTVLFNPTRNGFYRVAYDSSLLNDLKVPLSKLQLDPIDRLSIQTDSFALAQSGLIQTSQALELFESYKSEKNYTVWTDLLSNLSSISALVSHQSCSVQFNQWAAKLLADIATHVGWDEKQDESHGDSLLRPMVSVAIRSLLNKFV